jgi:hypothetical protein
MKKINQSLPSGVFSSVTIWWVGILIGFNWSSFVVAAADS